MKIKALLSAACVLLTAVPSALAEVSYICIAMYIPSDIFHMMCIVPLAMNHERFFLYSVLLIDQYNISRYLSLSILVYTLI